MRLAEENERERRREDDSEDESCRDVQPRKTTALQLVMWKEAQERLRPVSSSSLFMRMSVLLPVDRALCLRCCLGTVPAVPRVGTLLPGLPMRVVALFCNLFSSLLRTYAILPADPAQCKGYCLVSASFSFLSPSLSAVLLFCKLFFSIPARASCPPH